MGRLDVAKATQQGMMSGEQERKCGGISCAEWVILVLAEQSLAWLPLVVFGG